MCKGKKMKTFSTCRRFVFLLAFLLMSAPVFSQAVLPILEPNTPTERELLAGESHSYSISLEANQYARITARQAGSSILVKVFDSNEQQITQVKSFVQPGKTERLFVVTNSGGTHRLEITASEAQKTGGKYIIKVEEIRAAAEKDQFLMKAQETLSEAERLHAQGNAAAFQQALAKYTEAFQLWQKSGDLRGQADALHYQAVVFFSLGNTQKALEGLVTARQLYRETEEHSEEAVTLRGIGLIYHTLGELPKALEFYEQGLEINRELKNQVGEANDLGNIGGIYQYQGEYQKALEYYQNALELTRKFQNPGNEARLHNNIGEVYRLLSEYQNALDHLGEALELRRSIKDRRGEGTTLNNTALVYSELGDYSKALEFFNLSLSVRREIGDLRGESTTLHNISFVYYKTGENQKALELFQKALELKRKSGNRHSEASTLYLLGAVYSNLLDQEKALEYFQQALSHSREVGDRQTEASALKAISVVERKRGNLDQSRNLIEEAINIIESLRTNVATQTLRTTFLASKQDYYNAYIDLLMHLHREQPLQGFDAMALQISERARARSLVETLLESRAEIRQGVDTTLLETERTLQNRLNAKEDYRIRLLSRNPKPEQIEAVEKEIRSLLSEYQQVRVQIQIKSPNYAALIQPQSLQLKEIQKDILDGDTMLLEYALGEDRSYLWAVTPDSITSYTLPKRAEIETVARRFYKSLTARNRQPENETPRQRKIRLDAADKELAEATRQLSQMLLSPISSNLGNKRLLIVSDSVLQYIPFAALQVPDEEKQEKNGNGQLTTDNGQFLIETNEIVNLPSASTLTVLRNAKKNKKKEPKNLVAVLADAVFTDDDVRMQAFARKNAAEKDDFKNLNIQAKLLPAKIRSDFSRLRFSRTEAEAISALAPNNRKFVAMDFAANMETATGENFADSRIIHFATHGIINSDFPELSAVVLSLYDENGKPQKGFLRLHDIYNLQLNTDLVVLSACETALGREIKGEGIVGLTRGFMYAGAPTVIASLWKVEDRATADLMRRFYQKMLKENLSPSEALRGAQISMLKEKGNSHPFYWAGFNLQGDWQTRK